MRLSELIANLLENGDRTIDDVTIAVKINGETYEDVRIEDVRRDWRNNAYIVLEDITVEVSV